MISQKKCKECGYWNVGTNTHCASCNATIDARLLALEQRQRRDQANREKQLANENRFEKYLRKMEESEKPLNKVLFKVLSVVFNIYLAILSFFIWLIALISG